MTEQETRPATGMDPREYSPPDSGQYGLLIRAIDETLSRYPDERTGDAQWQYRFTTDLFPDGADSIPYTFWCSKTYTFGAKSSNLAKWVTGVLGLANAKAQRFEPAEWIERPLSCMIVQEFKDDGTPVARVAAWGHPTKSFLERIAAMQPTAEAIPI